MAEHKRAMAFIDGENLVQRYQTMLKEGREPNDQVRHRQGIYAWANYMLPFPSGAHYDLIRTSYYTTVVGAHEMIAEIESELKALTSNSQNNYNPIHSLHPVVFKKLENSRKGRIVDVRIVQDILSHVYQDNTDVVILVSGDSDFTSVIAEVGARGKQSVVAALSSGFSPDLRRAADVSIELDRRFFVPQPI